jgi:pyruvate carboxylase
VTPPSSHLAIFLVSHDTALMSYLMYPDVFSKFDAARSQHGELDVLPTPNSFMDWSGARRCQLRSSRATLCLFDY